MNLTEFSIPQLGTLRVLEIYEYYNEPLLFSCENRTGQIYIAVCVEEFDLKTRWFYLPVSLSRFNSIKQGIMSLQRAFLSAEDGSVWDVYELARNAGYETCRLSTSQISIDDLPADDSFLRSSPKSLPDLLVPALFEAERTKRDVLDISISSDNYHSTEINAETLGLVLLSTQGLIHALGYLGKSHKGRIPKEQEEDTTLRATYAYAASFGIRLESKSYDLFGETKSSSAINKFVSLVKTKYELTDLIEILSTAGIRVSSKYKYFLKTIRDNGLTISAEWGSPARHSDKASITAKDASVILQVLDKTGDIFTETHTLRGRLEGVYIASNSFWFTSEDGRHYKGELEEGMRGSTFPVPSDVTVEIEESLDVNEVTQQERFKFVLKKIMLTSKFDPSKFFTNLQEK